MDVPSRVIEACKEGDSDAFAELIELTHRDVYSLALRMAGNTEDAADIAQETYIKLLRTIKQFRGEAKFSTWLYRVTSTVAITNLRKRSRRNLDVPLEEDQWNILAAPDSEDPAVQAEQKSVRQRVDSALLLLPVQQRAVVVMKDIYGFSLAEIGSQMGITEGAAKVRLFRARQRLRKMLYRDNPSLNEEPTKAKQGKANDQL